jgi:hypothetical protein
MDEWMAYARSLDVTVRRSPRSFGSERRGALKRLDPALATAGKILALGWLAGACLIAVDSTEFGTWIVVIASLLGALRSSAAAMTLLFPATWPLWSVYVPLLGGRIERLIVGLAVIAFAEASALRRPDRARMPRPMAVALLTIVAGYAIAMVVATGPKSAFDSVLSLAARVLIVPVTVLAVTTRVRLRAVLWGLLGSAAGSALLAGYATWRWGFGFLREIESAVGFRREMGPYLSEVALNAQFGMIVVVLGIAWFGLRRTRREWMAGMAVVVGLSAAAILAQYRREVLITVAMIAIGTAVFGSRRQKPCGLVLCALAAGWFLLDNGRMMERFLEGFQEQETRSEVRVQSFRAGLAEALERPLFGAGPGSYPTVVERRIGYGEQTFRYSPYNSFIWIAVEGGVVPFLGLLALPFTVHSMISQRRSPKRRPSAQIIPSREPDESVDLVLKSANGWLFLVIVWFSFGNGVDLSLPWFLIGLIVAAAGIRRKEEAQLA